MLRAYATEVPVARSHRFRGDVTSIIMVGVPTSGFRALSTLKSPPKEISDYVVTILVGAREIDAK